MSNFGIRIRDLRSLDQLFLNLEANKRKSRQCFGISIHHEAFVDTAINEKRAFRISRLLLQVRCIFFDQKCQLSLVPQIQTSEAREPQWRNIFERSYRQPDNVFL